MHDGIRHTVTRLRTGYPRNRGSIRSRGKNSLLIAFQALRISLTYYHIMEWKQYYSKYYLLQPSHSSFECNQNMVFLMMFLDLKHVWYWCVTKVLRCGREERYNAILCTLPLDLISGSGFATDLCCILLCIKFQTYLRTRQAYVIICVLCSYATNYSCIVSTSFIKNILKTIFIVKKVKCTLVQAVRLCTGRTAHRGSRSIALLFRDHGTRRGWELASHPGLSLPLERPGIHCTGGWMGSRAGLERCGKSRPHRDSIPGPSTPQPVAIPTELSRLTIFIVFATNRSVTFRKDGRETSVER